MVVLPSLRTSSEWLLLHRLEVLSLYRQLLRAKNRLKYTNPNYYAHRVRTEFRIYQHEADPNKLSRLHHAGLRLLQSQDLGGIC